MSRQRTRGIRPGTFALAMLMGVADAPLGDAPIITRAMSASTIAEVFVEHDAIRVPLEIGVGDLAGMIHARVATDFLGHGYFHNNTAVAFDLILLLRDNRLSGREHGRPLKPIEPNFWEIEDGYPFGEARE